MALERSETGNTVRRALEAAGIPRPNVELVNVMAPAIQRSEAGTMRRWAYAKAEIMPLIEAMREDFAALDRHKDSAEQFEQLLVVAKNKFYGLLKALEDKKAATKIDTGPAS